MSKDRVKSRIKESLGKRFRHGLALVQEAWNKVRLQRGRGEMWGYSMGWSGPKIN